MFLPVHGLDSITFQETGLVRIIFGKTKGNQLMLLQFSHFLFYVLTNTHNNKR
jgi:hypothetical protein